MKRIKLELTEDQARDMVALIEGWLPSAEWYVGYYYADKTRTREVNQSKSKIAFRKRVLSKLNAELM